MRKLKDEINAKNEQITLLEKQIADSINVVHNGMDNLELSQVSIPLLVAAFLVSEVQAYAVCCFMLQSFTELMTQLNEKSFELEVMKFYSSLSKKIFLSFVKVYPRSMFGTHLQIGHLISDFYDFFFFFFSYFSFRVISKTNWSACQ